jgi:cobalt-zinc-cadmium resistance protein CzcA
MKVQVITTSQSSTQDIEQYITYPVEIEMAIYLRYSRNKIHSKFGLSVVTIVDDDLGTYFAKWCRKNASVKFRLVWNSTKWDQLQLVSEIYQYTLE